MCADRDIEQAADIEHMRNPSGERCPADWGSATDSQRCVMDAGHDEPHRDAFGAWSPDSGNTRADKMDIARVVGKESNRPGATVAGRGDATQADLTVIERAAVAMAKNDDDPYEWEALFQHEVERYLSLARAAAAVLVPTTAEQIAAAILARIDKFPKDWITYEDAAKVAHEFAAGLSAGATGGGNRAALAAWGGDPAEGDNGAR